MKVALINKSENVGGASVAASRLFKALRSNGIETTFIVQQGNSKEDGISVLDTTSLKKLRSFHHFVKERLFFLKHEKSKKERFAFSPANTGIDISKHPAIVDADIIHLHWINQGFLSLKSIDYLFKLGKPIVWTLHDMWTFTGGCHYAGTCYEFLEQCGYCQFLKVPQKQDLSAQLHAQKRAIYKNANLSIVTCSKWLRSLAKESSLLRQKDIYNIPNPIDTNLFKQLDKEECRELENLPKDKKLLLFGAQNLSDPRKGGKYLIEALKSLTDNFKDITDKLELVVFGKDAGDLINEIPLKIHQLSMVNDPERLVRIYNAADAFVLPSVQDNLPNTVMESMACGIPVVGFRIGGVPEMIVHKKTGYLAEVRNSVSLATGLYEVLFVLDNVTLGTNARQYVLESFSEQVIAQKYLDVYEAALKANN